ncbi:MAG: hypothetical protein QG567_1935, partial [Campylobacterota bacterium]|nr:hypothetical protein [Campylobacterota bacterium]
ANVVCEIVGNSNNLTKPNGKWFFDDGYEKRFMYNWYNQENNPNFKNCTQMTYEEFIEKYGDRK